MKPTTIATIDVWTECRGQECVKRALIVACACEAPVRVFIVGPPGVGKTMLADGARELSDRRDIAESWPCPCGNYGDPRLPCRCEPDAIHAWWRMPERIGPARVADISVEAPPVPAAELLARHSGTSLASARQQLADTADVRPEWAMDDMIHTLLRQAFSELGLSPRGFASVRRVACGCARLAGRTAPAVEDVMEAVQYRRLDRLLNT